MVTVLDEQGELLEDDQRALVRFVIQDGFGADVVFAAGTTGEWDKLPNRVRQRAICVCAEEVMKAIIATAPTSESCVVVSGEAWEKLAHPIRGRTACR